MDGRADGLCLALRLPTPNAGIQKSTLELR
jgi:hypothetical protein